MIVVKTTVNGYGDTNASLLVLFTVHRRVFLSRVLSMICPIRNVLDVLRPITAYLLDHDAFLWFGHVHALHLPFYDESLQCRKK